MSRSTSKKELDGALVEIAERGTNFLTRHLSTPFIDK